jgi:tetratricopeptide (TPR) repeat protein
VNANQITATLSQFESYVEKGAYTDAKKGLDGVLGIVEAEAIPLDAASFVRLVRALRELAEYDEHVLGDETAYLTADKVLTKATQLHDFSAPLINERGHLYFSKFEFEEALSEFKRVIDEEAFTEVDRVSAFQWASACYRRTYRTSQAETLIQAAATQFGDHMAGLAIERAWLQYDAQNYGKALSGFASVLEGDPTDESALIGQLCCIHLMGDKSNLARRMQSLRGLVPDKRILKILGKCAAIHDDDYSSIPPALRFNAALIAWDQMTVLDPENPYPLEMKSAVLRELREHRRAEELCRESLKKFPGHKGLKMALAWVHYNQQRYEEAHKEFSRRELRDEPEACEWVVTSLRRMNQFDEARKKVGEALSRFGDLAGLLSEKATLYFAERRYDEAIETFERALLLKKDDEFALQWRIAAQRKLRQFDRAAELMTNAIELLPHSSELYGEQGWLFFDQNKLEEAEAAFRRASELRPYTVRFAFGRVEVLLRMGRIGEAGRILEDLNGRFKDDEEVEERIGWFYLGQSRPFEAHRMFQSMLERDETSIAGINGMGGFYLDQRDYSSAEAQFRAAIRRVAYQPQYHVNLAWALLRQAHDVSGVPQYDSISGVKKVSTAAETLLAAAQSSCQEALNLDPFSAKAMECLGVIAFKRGRLVEAEDYFCSSIRADPQQGSHVDLGALYTQTGRYDDAERSLATALKLNKNDARALVESANLLLAKGELSRATAACRQAIFADPANDECYRALAITLMRAGQFTEAERVLRGAIGRLDEIRRWKLHLLLSQVLVHLGDDNNKDRMLYEEAMLQVNAARRTKGTDEEVHFHAGIVHFRLEDYLTARRSFAECLRSNSQRFDAERNARLINQRVREIRKVNRINYVGGLSLAGFCLFGLIVLWVLFLTGWLGKVDSTLITFMTPLLLGLIIVALLLPNLNKLKLPGGFEAEISEQKPREISSGPKGEIGFGSSQEAISPGPR